MKKGRKKGREGGKDDTVLGIFGPFITSSLSS